MRALGDTVFLYALDSFTIWELEFLLCTCGLLLGDHLDELLLDRVIEL